MTPLPALVAGSLALALAACAGVSGPVQEAPFMTPVGPSFPRIDAEAPAQVATATFAMGCFWCPDAVFGGLPGVVRTRVGYAGGTKKNPTYHDLGDQTESIQVDFDPSRISYARLLEVFWSSHHPSGGAYKRQYLSAIWVHDDGQKRLALASKVREEDRRGKALETEIAPLREFTLAEDYHQKYELRCDGDLIGEFRAFYGDAQLVHSTAAARVNAAIGGHIPRAQLQAEIEGYGLSAKARERLLHAARD